MVSRKNASLGKLVIIEHAGKIYQGSFHVKHGMITVSYGAQQIVAQMGEMPPTTRARMILREIVGGKAEKL